MFLSSKDILLLADPSVINQLVTGKERPTILTATPVLSVNGVLHSVSSVSVAVLAGLGGDNHLFIELPYQDGPQIDFETLRSLAGKPVTITLSVDPKGM